MVREKWFEKSGSRNLVREKWLTRKKRWFYTINPPFSRLEKSGRPEKKIRVFRTTFLEKWLQIKCSSRQHQTAFQFSVLILQSLRFSFFFKDFFCYSTFCWHSLYPGLGHFLSYNLDYDPDLTKESCILLQKNVCKH